MQSSKVRNMKLRLSSSSRCPAASKGVSYCDDAVEAWWSPTWTTGLSERQLCRSDTHTHTHLRTITHHGSCTPAWQMGDMQASSQENKEPQTHLKKHYCCVTMNERFNSRFQLCVYQIGCCLTRIDAQYLAWVMAAVIFFSFLISPPPHHHLSPSSSSTTFPSESVYALQPT